MKLKELKAGMLVKYTGESSFKNEVGEVIKVGKKSVNIYFEEQDIQFKIFSDSDYDNDSWELVKPDIKLYLSGESLKDFLKESNNQITIQSGFYPAFEGEIKGFDISKMKETIKYIEFLHQAEDYEAIQQIKNALESIAKSVK